MPYGVKRGVKAPGEYGISDILGLALAGSAGIIAALVTDYQQQGEASALYTINQWVVAGSRLLGIGDIPLWGVVLGLIGVGAGSVFYFQPITRQGAFAQGFGLLAVLMTAVPSDLAGGLEAYGHSDDLPGLEPVALHVPAEDIRSAAASSADARVVKVQDERGAAKYDVHLTIVFAGGLPEDIDGMIRKGTVRGRIHNENTGATYNLFRNAGGVIERRGDSLVIRAGVPARADTARLWVRIECEKFAIEERSIEASLGSVIEWRIDMQPSSTPLFLQRLNKSYWF